MKFYYIDDSVFYDTAFAKEIRYRLAWLLQKNDAKMLLISANNIKTDKLETFAHAVEHCSFLVAPALFDIEGIYGNLQKTFLEVEGYPVMHPYSGSCIEYDSKDKTCRRMYLDLFMKQETMDVDELIDELEEIIHKKMKIVKKKHFLIH